MAAKERHDSRVHLIAPLPYFNPLLGCPALVVEGHDALGWPRQVGDDEADPRIKLAWMPLDFRYHSAGLLPALRLIAEAGIVAAHLMRRSTDRAFEQISNLVLRDPVGRQPDAVTHTLGFEELVDLRVGKGRVAAEIAPLYSVPVTGDHLLQHRAPALGAVNVPRKQGTALHIVELVEHEKRVVTGAAEMPVVGAAFLLALGRVLARYHKISYDAAAIEGLFVELFVDAHGPPPPQITLDLDATDDPLHGHLEERFFHGYYDSYCYLPLYVFCGRHLLAAKLRPANIDASAGSIEEVARIVTRIRRRWPKVRILLRGDSGFAREALMAWCENNGVDFLFGLAKNSRLVGEIAAELTAAQEQSQRTKKPAGRFKDFCWRTPNSWSRERRVVGKAEWTAGKANPRLVSARWGARNTRPGTSTRSSTAHAARWRTGSRNASSTFMLIAPRPRRCAPTSCGCGLPRWPMCCCAPCAASARPTLSSPAPRAAPSASSC